MSQFTYDQTGQLTGAQNTFERDEAYSYDANGNRTGTGYDTSVSHNQLDFDPNYTYTYDGEGNRLSRTDKQSGDKEEYTWDHRNRLTAVIFKNSAGTQVQQIDYTYDAFDRLVRKATDKATFGDLTNAVLEYFGYDGQDLLIDMLDADGTDDNPPVLSHRYLQGPAVDQILAQETVGGETLWMLTDHQGSVRDLVRNDGTIAAHYQYDSFGKPLDGLENVTRFGYAGYERDTATGYYKTDTRWYDPQSGKWLSEDASLGPDVNPFRYVGNGPTDWVDPDGREEQPSWTIRPRNRVAELQESIRIGRATKDRMLESAAIEALARERVLRNNNLGIDDARQMTCERGDPLDNLRGFISGTATTVVSVVLEPVDWALTAWEIYKDPRNPISYASLLPGVSVTAAKAAKKVIAAGVETAAGRLLPFVDADRLTEINKTLDLIEADGPFPHVNKDGSPFENRRGDLPSGEYKEYTVNTPGCKNRGARRIVVEETTKATYYTDDHYKTFIRIDAKGNK